MKNIRIPYGISDYRQIRTEDYVYVDKTGYIETLEYLDTKYPLFLRPRRFGKSLFVSTLFYYYDRNSQELFDQLFDNTYIKQHKTALANSYYVLRFDFSKLSSDDEHDLKRSFYRSISERLKTFDHYYDLKSDWSDNDDYNSADLLDAFLGSVERHGEYPVYIMIDEYDHFANNILRDTSFFHSVTSRDGFIRNFYETVKAHTGNGCVDRIFITGVTPLTMDSLTSGFNIGINVSTYAQLNEMAGFTEDETEDLLMKVMEAKEKDNEIALIRTLLIDHYNGYLFNVDGRNIRVFNSNLVLYFLMEYQRLGKVPRHLTDANIRSDYDRLASMFTLFEDESRRRALLEAIMTDQTVETDLVTSFNLNIAFEEQEFLSMLFYLGLLTIKGEGWAAETLLAPPNSVIRDIYYDYYTNYLTFDKTQRRNAIAAIALNDDFTAFNQLLTEVLQLHSNDDFQGFDEARLKSVFLACLGNQNHFLVKSEYESAGKRIDIALFDKRVSSEHSAQYNYLIELKYIMKKDLREKAKGLSEMAVIDKTLDSARMQLQEYMKLEEFSADKRVKGLVYVVVKDRVYCGRTDS